MALSNRDWCRVFMAEKTFLNPLILILMKPEGTTRKSELNMDLYLVMWYKLEPGCQANERFVVVGNYL